MRWPFAWIGKPCRTIHEQRIAAWRKVEGDGLPQNPKVTCPIETRKQWTPIARFKRRAS